ncbi:MAG: quinate 5-dehydrogenase [bacterium]|nr:quinate 5-dehydrogenase [bacterium]
MKKVLSVSIGSSKRDKTYVGEFLGEEVEVGRTGTDGDLKKAGQIIKELDGKIDCFGIGGTDIYLWSSKRKYRIKDAWNIAKNAKISPVVDGGEIKHTLERQVIKDLVNVYKIIQKGDKALLVSGVDRIGMAEALDEVGCETVYGDFLFALKINKPIKSLKELNFVAATLLPIMGNLPFKWLYPTGKKQEEFKPRFPEQFNRARIIAGDFHYIRKYMPMDMSGKIIVTNTTTKEDVELLKGRGVKTLITTTPRMGDRSFGTNVLQSLIVAISGMRPENMKWDDYSAWIKKLDLKPSIEELN